MIPLFCQAPMKSIAILLLASVLPAAAQRAVDFATAKNQAKAANRPFAVLLTGSDWNPPSRAMLETWNRPELESMFTGKVLLVSVDKKEGTAEDKKNKDADSGIRSYPGLALYDAKGRLVSSLSGAPQIQAAGGLPRAIAAMLKVWEERETLWTKAAAAKGPQQAALIGAGLDRMGRGLGPRNTYKPELDLIKKADPKDTTGYAAKYEFSSQKFVNRIADAKTDADFAPIETELNALARNTRLTTEQRQETQAARFALYKKWPGKTALARKALEATRDADPKSDIGLGAVEYLKIFKE